MSSSAIEKISWDSFITNSNSAADYNFTFDFPCSCGASVSGSSFSNPALTSPLSRPFVSHIPKTDGRSNPTIERPLVATPMTLSSRALYVPPAS